MVRFCAFIFTGILACASIPQNVGVEPYKRFPLQFVDEAKADSDLIALRDRVLAAVRSHDFGPVRADITPELFKRQETRFLNIDPASSDWRWIEDALTLGGSFSTTHGAVRGRREFCAPYSYSTYPDPPPYQLSHEADPWVIVGPHVAARALSRTDAPVLGWLSYELVPILIAPGHFDPWAKVALPDGRSAWVRHEDIRDPADYHACFAKVDGRWMMSDYRDRGPR